MSAAHPDLVETLREAVDAMRAKTGQRPAVLGLCGAQGSGKSTAAAALAHTLEEDGLCCAILSLDDLYLLRADRMALAREVHPLLKTRGPPGTHDVALGLQVLSEFRAGKGCSLPRFDKALDERMAASTWPRVKPGCDVMLFEGWCVGALPQREAALRNPANALEALEDSGGVWRRFVNTALAGPYQTLFGMIDHLVLLRAPNFEIVPQWRMEQERALCAASGRITGQIMDKAAIERFVAHYERLTRHILAEMPNRAEVTIDLDALRTPLRVFRNVGAQVNTPEN